MAIVAATAAAAPPPAAAAMAAVPRAPPPPASTAAGPAGQPNPTARPAERHFPAALRRLALVHWDGLAGGGCGGRRIHLTQATTEEQADGSDEVEGGADQQHGAQANGDEQIARAEHADGHGSPGAGGDGAEDTAAHSGGDRPPPHRAADGGYPPPGGALQGQGAQDAGEGGPARPHPEPACRGT